MTIRFAVIGANHNHIYGQVNALLRAGAEFIGFHIPEDGFATAFGGEYPKVERIADKRRILENPSVQLVVTAGIPADRAPLGVEVMRHGKDFMTDKPGVISLEQLAEVRRVQADTKRIYSILYSEHFETRSTVRAGELVRAGAIGKVINTVGLGPHRLNKPLRAGWFFERDKYGGIITDIASHQCEQFLFFTDALDAQVTAANIANCGNPGTPGLQDFGDFLMRTDDATGYVRVDWFTPDGLPTWGDGRLFITGTRRHHRVAQICRRRRATWHRSSHSRRPEGRSAHRLLGCRAPYGRDLVNDILHRTETAMPQERCFNAMKIALAAQAMAKEGPRS